MPRGISSKVQSVGDKVTARGVQYEIVRISDGLNGANEYVLKDAEGARYKASGKRIQHNTVVLPANGQ